jgi:hypothetical protein
MNNFIDVCKLLGNYNDKDVYLYMSSKYKSNSIFYSPNYYLLPKWVEDPEKLTFMQAVKIINFRMKNKNKNSDDLNVKEMIKESENIDISIKEK